MSVRLFACCAAPSGRICAKFYTGGGGGGVLRKSADQDQSWLKSDKNIGHFTSRLAHVLYLLAKQIRHKSHSVQQSIFLYR
jgi:hypothetical protein